MPEGNVTVKAVFQVHSYGDWQIGNSKHWRQCSCGAVSEKTDHADSDQDPKCDVCGKTLMEHTGGKATCKKAKETLRRLFFCDFYEFIPPQRRACGY